MKQHLLAAALAAALLGACGAPEDDYASAAVEDAGVAAVVATDDTAETAGSAEANRKAWEDEQWKKLEGVVAAPPEPGSEPTDKRWFILATKVGRCLSITDAFPLAETPADVLSVFEANGRPLEIAPDRDEDDEYVRLRSTGDPSDPGMAFVQGEKLCTTYMAFAEKIE